MFDSQYYLNVIYSADNVSIGLSVMQLLAYSNQVSTKRSIVFPFKIALVVFPISFMYNMLKRDSVYKDLLPVAIFIFLACTLCKQIDIHNSVLVYMDCILGI